MELRQLRYFACLYEEGSTTHAAKKLKIAQPAISNQIAKLEADFGCPLFVRASRGMIPTEAAHIAYRLFVPLMRQMQMAKQTIANCSDHEIKDHVRFGVVSAVSSNRKSNEIITTAISELLKSRPFVTVQMANDYTQELVDLVRSNRLDFAIVNTTADGLKMPFQPILEEHLVLVSSRKNSTRFPKIVDLRKIDPAKLVLPSTRHDLRTVIDQVANTVGVQFSPQVEFDKISFIINFLQSGDWLSILPLTAIHTGLHDRTLRAARINTPAIFRQLIWIQSPHHSLPVAGRMLITQITKQLQKTLSDSRQLAK